jgi:hypothetical protein
MPDHDLPAAFTPEEAAILLAPPPWIEDLCCCIACRKEIPAYALFFHWRVYTKSQFLPPGTAIAIAQCLQPKPWQAFGGMK